MPQEMPITRANAPNGFTTAVDELRALRKDFNKLRSEIRYTESEEAEVNDIISDFIGPAAEGDYRFDADDLKRMAGKDLGPLTNHLTTFQVLYAQQQHMRRGEPLPDFEPRAIIEYMTLMRGQAKTIIAELERANAAKASTPSPGSGPDDSQQNSVLPQKPKEPEEHEYIARMELALASDTAKTLQLSDDEKDYLRRKAAMAEDKPGLSTPYRYATGNDYEQKKVKALLNALTSPEPEIANNRRQALYDAAKVSTGLFGWMGEWTVSGASNIKPPSPKR